MTRTREEVAAHRQASRERKAASIQNERAELTARFEANLRSMETEHALAVAALCRKFNVKMQALLQKEAS